VTERPKATALRGVRLAVWSAFALAFAFLYYRYSGAWGTEIGGVAQSSVFLAYAIYLVLGAVRGFALIPVTNLVVIAIPIFPPLPLFVLTLIGILISSASIYAFAGSLHIAEYFERTHAEKTERVRAALKRNPTTIVTAWSFFPIVPTDLICYVCGVMKISFGRFIAGVLIGEGAICAIYIFAGATLLDLGQRWFGADVAEAQVASRPLEVPEGGQPSGEAVYAEHCALCHEQINERIPHRSALQQMSSARIVRALDAGAMLAIAMTMNRDERLAVADYLGTAAADAIPAAAAYCSDRTVTLSAAARAWNGWSPTLDNARYQTTDNAGLTAAQIPRLTLRWAFGFAGDVTAFAAPTIVDGHVFVGSAGGVVHALDADTGCIKWTLQLNGPVRAAPLAVVEGGRPLLLFGDLTGSFHAVDAATGALRWSTRIETHDSTRLTGTAAEHDGVVYVPVSSWEESRAGDPDYPCCTFRGSLVALRVRDGAKLWQTYLTEAPREVGQNGSGAPLYGPSGAAIWSTPTIDADRNLLYVTTGDNYTEPATPTSDAVIALALDDGRIVWSRQITAGDAYNGSCTRDHRSNCPFEAGPDFDFGSSAILSRGGTRLLAGQKSGIVYALDATREGAILWQTRVGEGGLNGGVQWGMATDGEHVYAATSDVGRTRWAGDPFDTRRYILDPKRGGGLTALRVADGSRVWHAAAAPCPDGAPAGCSPAQPGAVTLIPGAVFATSNDGHVRAHAAADGRVLWDFDTAREFAAVNGVPARGGSLDGQGVVVADGLVLVASGYPRNGGMPGNVLLAFRAD
jgi:polyvinyl alcohol dehydrogenase (cytochrome)